MKAPGQWAVEEFEAIDNYCRAVYGMAVSSVDQEQLIQAYAATIGKS